MYKVDLEIFRTEYLEMRRIALELHEEILVLGEMAGSFPMEKYEELRHSEEKLQYMIRCMQFAGQEYDNREKENWSFVESIHV